MAILFINYLAIFNNSNLPNLILHLPKQAHNFAKY